MHQYKLVDDVKDLVNKPSAGSASMMLRGAKASVSGWSGRGCSARHCVGILSKMASCCCLMMFCGLRIKAVGVGFSHRVVEQTLSSNSLVQTLISFATCLTRRLKNTTSKFLLFEHFVGLVPLGRIPPGGESRLARGVEHRAHSLFFFLSFFFRALQGWCPLVGSPRRGLQTKRGE